MSGLQAGMTIEVSDCLVKTLALRYLRPEILCRPRETSAHVRHIEDGGRARSRGDLLANRMANRIRSVVVFLPQSIYMMSV